MLCWWQPKVAKVTSIVYNQGPPPSGERWEQVSETKILLPVTFPETQIRRKLPGQALLCSHVLCSPQTLTQTFGCLSLGSRGNNVALCCWSSVWNYLANWRWGRWTWWPPCTCWRLSDSFSCSVVAVSPDPHHLLLNTLPGQEAPVLCTTEKNYPIPEGS